MSGQYILDENGNPVLETDILKWGKWMQKADRHIAFDRLPMGVQVSTVFLGLDHSFSDGDPVLWETMIFGGPHDQYQERYATLEAAKHGHMQALSMAKG